MITDTTVRPLFDENKNLTVVNMFGGAGCGKSVTAAYLFGHMKCNNMKVELVHEVAKKYVWERWSQIFGEQDWMFANQHRLIRQLIGHDIDYAVVDSSILLSLFYLPDDFPQSFRPFVLDVFNSYDNINIFIERNPDLPYIQAGRNQDLAEAKEIDQQIYQYFADNNISHHVVMAGATAAEQCLEIVKKHKQLTDVCPKCGHDWLDHDFGVPMPYCP